MTEYAEEPKAWLEFIDPVSGRKVDVTVSMHSASKIGRAMDVSIVNRFASFIEDEMGGGSDGERTVRAELSDFEPAGLEEA